MSSIRQRLLLGTVLAVALSSAVASAAAWLSVRSHLLAAAESSLRAEAVRLLGQMRRSGCEIRCAPGNAAPIAFDGWWTVVDMQGVVCASSAPGAEALLALADGVATMPDGCAGRVVRVSGQIQPGGGGRGRREGADHGDATFTVAVARSDAGLQATLTAVGLALGTATAVAAVLAGAAAWILARAVIRPVDRIASAIAAAKPEDERIAVAGAEVPRELRPVVERADAFLAMSRDLVRRERQTAGNIAHELRTPLAGLAAVIDHVLARERAPADYRQALERSRGIVGETAGIVEQLLLLTRLEAGREPVRPAAVGLEDALTSVLAGFGEAERRRIALPTGAAPPVRGDRDHLLLVLRNLLDNAVSHAPAGSPAGLHAIQQGSSLVMQLSNPAPGMTAEMLPRLGEAFWRGEDGRGSTGRHAGLGLALCRRLAAVNGWELGFTLDAGTFTAALRLPLAEID